MRVNQNRTVTTHIVSQKSNISSFRHATHMTPGVPFSLPSALPSGNYQTMGFPSQYVSTIPPSVHKGSKSPPPPNAVCKPHRESGDGEFVCEFNFFLPHSQCFLTLAFSIKLLFCCWCQCPSLIPQRELEPAAAIPSSRDESIEHVAVT